jgi:hypothetical protein
VFAEYGDSDVYDYVVVQSNAHSVIAYSLQVISANL